MAKIPACPACGVRLRSRPDACPLCGASVDEPPPEEPRDVDDYQARVRELRARLQRLRHQAKGA